MSENHDDIATRFAQLLALGWRRSEADDEEMERIDRLLCWRDQLRQIQHWRAKREEA